MRIENSEFPLSGAPISRGIAIGKPLFLRQQDEAILETANPNALTQAEVDHEVARYQCALEGACSEIKHLQNSLNIERVFDGAAILDVHLQILQDPLLTTQVEIEIRRSKKNVDYVFQSLIQDYQQRFNSIADPFFRERFKDIQDVSRRVTSHLRKKNSELGMETNRNSLTNVPHDTIIFASDLTAFDIAEACSKTVVAFVSQDGGATSHAAIMAKAKGIPYVSSINLEEVITAKDTYVIVDGRTGDVIINPSLKTLEKYQQLKNQLCTHLEKIKGVGKLKSETYDGYQVKLFANIEMPEEQAALHEYGASGVGLLRTELTFLTKECLPTEDEQFAVYHQFVVNMKGLPIVFRVFDWGGDKCPVNAQSNFDPTGSLGCRAIRLLLREKEMFKTQLRAIMRASAYGDVSIMFPMISSLSELIEAKALMREVREELINMGDSVADYIPVGCMIEIPSAVMIADILAKECDFLSIGTNDLLQYSLAIDRSNSRLSDLCHFTHPSIIRLIKLVVSEANEQGIPVCVCGEMASDPRLVPLLLGLGVHELSVSPRYLAAIKNAIRSTSIVNACKLAEEALTLDSADKISLLIDGEYRQTAPEDCFYNC